MLYTIGQVLDILVPISPRYFSNLKPTIFTNFTIGTQHYKLLDHSITLSRSVNLAWIVYSRLLLPLSRWRSKLKNVCSSVPRLTCLATHSAVMPTHSVNRETGNTLENSYITLPPQHTKAHGHTHTHKLQKSAGLLQPNIRFFWKCQTRVFPSLLTCFQDLVMQDM